MQIFRNRKKGCFWLLGIVAILLILVSLITGSNPPFIIIGKPTAYTTDELADLYWERKDELGEVAEIVLGSGAFLQRMIDNYDDDRGILTEYVKDDFSKEEWDKIVKLFRAIRPYMIMRSLKAGDDVIYFVFGQRKVDDHTYDTMLFYFKNPETAEYYKRYTWVGTLEHLDGNWYIGEDIE